MKYLELRDHLKDITVFTPHDIRFFDPSSQLVQLSRWEKQGLISRITRGYYIFNEVREKIDDYGLFSIANKIYEPSYISLESALRYYNLIPDILYATTSVSTRKTTRFSTSLGNFYFKSLKPQMMIGYKIINYGSFPFKIADKEKAVVDYLYFHPQFTTPGDMHEIRINTDELFENFREDSYWKYVAIAESKALEKRARVFLEYWRNPTYVHY